MIQIKLTHIMQWDKSLDLFQYQSPDRELLEKGLYPPLPFSGNILIWGFNLVKAAGQKGIEALNAEEFPGLEPEKQLILALKLENRYNAYSWQDKEGIIDCLERTKLSTEEKTNLLEKYVEPDLLARFIKYKALPGPARFFVEHQLLDLKTAHNIRELPAEVFTLYTQTTCRCNLSFSDRRLLFTWLYEVYRHDKLTTNECLDLLRTILATDNPVMQLRILRFPHQAELEQRFNRFTGRLLSGSGIVLKAPENFEGARFSAAFSFTPKNLERKLGYLQKIKENINELTGLL